jgi:aspartate racemase
LKTLGLIGGCSAESTSLYYAGLNALVRQARPGHGARVLLWSFDFAEIDAFCQAGRWSAALRRFREAGLWLQRGGAEALLICTNTMHRIAAPLAGGLQIPVINLIDATAEAVRRAGCARPALIGARFVMQEAFYRAQLEQAGLEVRLPSLGDQATVHDIIYDELVAGRASDAARARVRAVISRLGEAGADSVILGCTELGLLIRPGESPLPAFDTADIHIRAGAAFALGEPSAAAAP